MWSRQLAILRFVWWFVFGSQCDCTSGELAKHAKSAANTLTEFHVCISFALSQMTCNFIAENAVELIQLIGAASAVLSVFLSLSLPGFFLSISLSLSSRWVQTAQFDVELKWIHRRGGRAHSYLWQPLTISSHRFAADKLMFLAHEACHDTKFQ